MAPPVKLDSLEIWDKISRFVLRRHLITDLDQETLADELKLTHSLGQIHGVNVDNDPQRVDTAFRILCEIRPDVYSLNRRSQPHESPYPTSTPTFFKTIVSPLANVRKRSTTPPVSGKNKRRPSEVVKSEVVNPEVVKSEVVKSEVVTATDVVDQRPRAHTGPVRPRSHHAGLSAPTEGPVLPHDDSDTSLPNNPLDAQRPRAHTSPVQHHPHHAGLSAPTKGPVLPHDDSGTPLPDNPLDAQRPRAHSTYYCSCNWYYAG